MTHVVSVGMAANSEQVEPVVAISEKVDDTENYCDDASKQETKGLSKNQLKKQRKTQRWLEHKYQKRQDERAKKKMKRKEARERGEDLGPSRKLLKQNRMADSSCQIKVVIDCSFDDLMKEREVNSLVCQLNFCYASNRRAKNPMQFYVTSCSGKTESRLSHLPDHKSWDVHFRKDHFEQVFDKEKVVYLSSDSDHVLEKLVEDEIYVIGGLVDHNAHKGHCHAMAVERGYRHAQLPIGKYVELKSRKVLAVNHVFDILLSFTENGDWEESFYKVIPKRKVNREETDNSETSSEANENFETSSGVNGNSETSSGATEISETSSVVNKDCKPAAETNSDTCDDKSLVSLNNENNDAAVLVQDNIS